MQIRNSWTQSRANRSSAYQKRNIRSERDRERERELEERERTIEKKLSQPDPL
jgi:hypothetical protein